MTKAEKYIQEYNRFNGKKIFKKDLVEFHSRLKSDIDAKRIDAHVNYGVELLAIEKRIAKALPKVSAKRVKVIVDHPVRVKLKKPRNIIITQTAQGPEVVRAKNKAVHYHHEDITMFYGLPCDPPEAEESGLGFTKEGQQKIYDMITNMILKIMKDHKELPWRKPWTIKNILATNFKSKKAYKGANLYMLNLIAPMFFGKIGPYWLTYKQAQELGGQVKKGAQGFPVIYYSVYHVVNKPKRKTITEEQYNAMTPAERTASGAVELFTINYYNVFAQEDITGIEFPAPKGDRRDDATPIETAQAIIDGMPKRPEIIHHNQGRAYYSPSDDHIKLPPIGYFHQDQEYYSTLFHELVHATGHESRLNRFGKNKAEAEGKDDYAYEELIAELGASYLNAEAGTLYFTMNNSASYLKGWQSKLEDIMKEDNKFFLKAAAQASKAADFILNVSENKPAEVPPVDKNREPVKREAPPQRKKSYALNGVVDASAIASHNFSCIDLDGEYKSDFLKIYSDTQLMIWGAPGSGKTVYTLKFAQYLAEKKGLNVLYIANEELGRSTFTEKIREFNIGHPNLKFVKSLDALKSSALDVGDFDVILFDSVNSMGYTLEDYRKFSDANPGVIKILVVQSTKDGDFRGGKDWEHEVDIAGEVKNRKMILRKNRLDQEFAQKSDKLMIDEMVQDQKRKKLIREKVQNKTDVKNE
jgi:antirestriction protein ArdC